MVRNKFYCYRSWMGDIWTNLSKNLPLEVYDKVYTFWLIHSVECMFAFPEFELFRASYKGVQITFQQYVDSTWCCKIKY